MVVWAWDERRILLYAAVSPMPGGHRGKTNKSASNPGQRPMSHAEGKAFDFGSFSGRSAKIRFYYAGVRQKRPEVSWSCPHQIKRTLGKLQI